MSQRRITNKSAGIIVRRALSVLTDGVFVGQTFSPLREKGKLGQQLHLKCDLIWNQLNPRYKNISIISHLEFLKVLQ